MTMGDAGHLLSNDMINGLAGNSTLLSAGRDVI